MSVGVIGLGYVGLPLSVAFAEAGQDVIAVDNDEHRVSSVAAGTSYVEDIPSERLRAALPRIHATLEYAPLAEVEAVLMCVPTPLTVNREPELGPLIAAAEALGDVLISGQLVVLESTTYPGTTREQLVPILESRSGLRVGETLNVAYSPERVDPGRTDYTLWNTPKVIGGVTPACTGRAAAIYSQVCGQLIRVGSPEVAELSKLLENIFRSVNIALVNELAIVAERMGIDIWEVVDAAATKPYGFMRFDPGPGMGGHCLPVDPFYLTWRAREFHMSTEFIELAGKINQQMPNYCVERVERALNDVTKPVKGSKIAIVGVSYKGGIGDIRESPALRIIEALRERGGELCYSDPYVPHLPEYGLSSVPLQEAIADADAVVLVTAHPELVPQTLARDSALLIDLRGITRPLDQANLKRLEALSMPVRFERPTQFLARRWWVIVLCGAVAGLGTLIVSLTVTKQYTASATLLFEDPGFTQDLFGASPNGSASLDSAREAETDTGLASLNVISMLTADALGRRLSPVQVHARVRVAPLGQSDLAEITATDSSPQFAATLANTYAQQFIAYRQNAYRGTINAALRVIQSQIAKLTASGQANRTEAGTLAARADQLQELSALQTGNVQIAQSAALPSSASSPHIDRDGLLGLLIGLLIGLGAALVLEHRDRVISEPRAIAAAYGLPLLGAIPQNAAYAGRPDGEDDVFRRLSVRIEQAGAARSVLVTSGGTKDGRSTVALHLAAAESSGGRRVLLIDADFRRPSLGERLGFDDPRGLSDVLSGEATLDQAIATVELPSGGADDADDGSAPLNVFRVLPAGTLPPRPAELASSQRMSQTIGALSRLYDRVIVDGPPLSFSHDVAPLIRQVEGVLVVSRIGRDTRDGARRVGEHLRSLDAATVGVVANHVPRTVVTGSGSVTRPPALLGPRQ